jgi:phospholipase/carboxylesterase
VSSRWIVAAVLVALAVACHEDTVPAADAPRFIERVVPARRRTDGARAPLLVLLHGIGADENDLVGLAPSLDPRFTVVSLRAPRPYHVGYAWFQIDWKPDGSIVPNATQARETLADLVRWLAAVPARLDADPDRLYLLGFSQGAMMSFGVLRTAPERLAGVVALSGLFDEDIFAAPADAAATARVPVFLAHGTHDDVLPLARGRAVRDFFQPRQRDVTYREYPVAHSIAPDELHDVAAWLTAQLDQPRP